MDDAFRFTYANSQFSGIMGYTMKELIGSDFRSYLDEESLAIVADRYVRRQRGEAVPPRYEFNIIRKDGRKRRVEISSSVVKDIGGMIRTVGQILDVTENRLAQAEVQRSQANLESRVRDRTVALTRANALLQQEILQRKQTQESLRLSELKYRHLVENANCIILEMDTSGQVTFFNEYAERFFGYSNSEILGRSVIGTIVPPKDSSGKDLELMIEDVVHHPERYRHNENENMRRSGERVWIVWTNQPVFEEDGRLSEVLCIGIDHTEQKKAEELAAQQAGERAAADERSRLARDLHDAVSQTLFSASLIAEVLPRLWEQNEKEGRKRLEEIRQLTRGALAEMRTLLLELRPTALVDTEMSELLRQLSESITGRARVPVAVEVEGQCTLSPEVKVALYRIAQEALNNVAKHSCATEAKVRLISRPGKVTLRIGDNGRGFDKAGALPNSLGIGIMRERAEGVGASLTIESHPGRGTEVVTVWTDKLKENGS